jgi:hypothetical protein
VQQAALNRQQQVVAQKKLTTVATTAGLTALGAWAGDKLFEEGGAVVGAGVGLLTGLSLNRPAAVMPSVDEIIGTERVNGTAMSPLMAEVIRERRGEVPKANSANEVFALDPKRIAPRGIDAAAANVLTSVRAAKDVDAALVELSKLPQLQDLAKAAGGEVQLFYLVNSMAPPMFAAMRGGQFANVIEIVALESGELRVRVTGQRARALNDFQWGLGPSETTLDRRVSTDWFRPMAWSGNRIAEEGIPVTPEALAASLESLLTTGAPTKFETTEGR